MRVKCFIGGRCTQNQGLFYPTFQTKMDISWGGVQTVLVSRFILLNSVPVFFFLKHCLKLRGGLSMAVLCKLI